MKKNIIIFLFIFCSLTPTCLAFQFQDYSWGTPLDILIKQFNQQEKIFGYTDNTLSYHDEIEGEACDVYLIFSSGSKKLSLISISWKSTTIGEQVKRMLTEELGEPQSEAKNIYIWFGPKNDSDSSVYLNYATEETTLVYYGGKDYEKYVEEKQQRFKNSQENGAIEK